MKHYTQRRIDDLYELTESAKDSLKGSKYYNNDLAPTVIEDRSWKTYHIASLWAGMAICIPTYTLAASYISMGFSWLGAMGIIVVGCLIMLVPIQLNSHAGTKYGVPFPVFTRLSFGMRGGQLPSLIRSLIATGWVGIQAWIGGTAINAAIGVMFPGWMDFGAGVWICYYAFFALNFFIAYKGSNAIKFMESIGAPLLVVLAAALVVWAVIEMKGQGASIAEAFSITQNNTVDNFALTLMAAFSGIFAYWSTMSINVPDFSRYAKNQKCARNGLILGMPVSMLVFSLVGIFVTGATIVLFGEAIWDPVAVIAKINSPVAGFLGCIGIGVATLTTNVACNILGPANGYSNLAPSKISYKRGVLITGAIALLIPTWQIYSDPNGFVMGWLGTVAILTGGFGGIYTADYYIHRKTRVDLVSLFKDGATGRYWYKNGMNTQALIVWALASALPVIGIFASPLAVFKANGWIFSYVVGFVLYALIMKNKTDTLVSDDEYKNMVENN